jgi:hypothetical protein
MLAMSNDAGGSRTAVAMVACSRIAVAFNKLLTVDFNLLNTK